jgi:hypothetical protein
MFPLSKRWMMVSRFGYGVLLSLALVGAVRLVYRLLGTRLSEEAAGYLFLIGSLSMGTLFVYLYTRSLKHAELAGNQARR